MHLLNPDSAALIDHYESHHVPLILSLAPAPEHHVRNYLPAAGARAFAADFDVMTHMKFASEVDRRS